MTLLRPRGRFAHQPTVLFYARVPDAKLFELLEFYAEDIRSLEALGFNVITTNSVTSALFSSADVLYAWWWHSSLPVIAGWRARRRPVVVTGTSDLHETWTSTSAFRRGVKEVLTRWASKLSTVNITVSDHERAKLAAVGAKRVELLYLSVDTDFFQPSPKFPNPTAVSVGQLNPLSIKRKGIDVAIQAAALVQKTVPDFQLLLVGPTTDAGIRAVRAVQHECGLSEVEVTGEVTRDEKRQLLGASWFSLQPSIYEGFGLSVLEAMASGTIPVCSRAGALPEVVGAAGVLLDRADPRAVSDAVLRLIDNAEARDTLERAARGRAQTFDSRAHTSRLGLILLRWGIAVPSPEHIDAEGLER